MLSLAELRTAINSVYLQDEQTAIATCFEQLPDYPADAIVKLTKDLISNIRGKQNRQSLIAAFLHEYQLDSDEGMVLMEIAEALLRIPDSQTQDLFLQEKLSTADWQEHLMNSDSLLVNFSTGALMLTGMLEGQWQHSRQQQQHIMQRLFSRLGAPLIRSALKQAMQQLAYQFVIAETIETAIKVSQQQDHYRYSFDMLGEAALTADDAERYFQDYSDAIQQLARFKKPHTGLYDNPGISIKLSALCPRFETSQRQRAVKEIATKLLTLVKQARLADITVTLDAEETERLDMSLEIFEHVFAQDELEHWPGLGLAVQAYQKRALPLLHWLAGLAMQHRRTIPVRLVKGAYWDTEIKKAQESGLADYPVFTWKNATDVAYLACAGYLLSKPKIFYPQFATHNAHTIAAIYQLGNQHPGYEFQRLHGMGEVLYEAIMQHRNWNIPCRIYAPVGNYQQLLPYLVRRLLENGANTSFINRIENTSISVTELAVDPVLSLRQNLQTVKASIILPDALYGQQRVNSRGFNFGDPEAIAQLQKDNLRLSGQQWQATAIVNGEMAGGDDKPVLSPFDQQLQVGQVNFTNTEMVESAVQSAAAAYNSWRLCPVETRAGYLQQAADLFEQQRLELASLCIREGGRTLKDALAEIREAIDFCRYYAASALQHFSQAEQLPGPTGESNQLFYYGRGVFVCISPWNFPVAIFIGQITAALAAGNTVIAKPSSLTPLSAFRCVQLLHQAGIPPSVLQFLPVDSTTLAKYCLANPAIAGVAFTGSTAAARSIHQTLANAHDKIVPLIAETGGQNVMIADSSAHAEQLVQDVLVSAFNSAGQRCSALRVLFLQQEIADRVIAMLIGAMKQLVIGDPGELSTDVGPVINADAVRQLSAHVVSMQGQAKLLYQCLLPKALSRNCFFPPTLLEIASL